MNPSAAAKHKASVQEILRNEGIEADVQVVLGDKGLEIRVSIRGRGRRLASQALPATVGGLKVVIT